MFKSNSHSKKKSNVILDMCYTHEVLMQRTIAGAKNIHTPYFTS